MQLRAKRIEKLQEKIRKFENGLVIKYLNSRGYKCDDSTLSMIKINRKINSELKKVIVERHDEKITKLGSYYIWNGMLRIKLVDAFTGKEV